MRARTSERFEQKNVVAANQLVFGFGVIAVFFALYTDSWALFILWVPLVAMRMIGFFRRSTVVEVTNTHLKIEEKGQQHKIRWDEISKLKATETSMKGISLDRVVRFKHGRKRHKLIISDLEDEAGFMNIFAAKVMQA